jgi:hypothetical protein
MSMIPNLNKQGGFLTKNDPKQGGFLTKNDPKQGGFLTITWLH